MVAFFHPETHKTKKIFFLFVLFLFCCFLIPVVNAEAVTRATVGTRTIHCLMTTDDTRLKNLVGTMARNTDGVLTKERKRAVNTARKLPLLCLVHLGILPRLHDGKKETIKSRHCSGGSKGEREPNSLWCLPMIQFYLPLSKGS